MTWGATAVAATTVVGSYLSSQANKSAANTSAEATRYAADQAAEAAKFNPVGITTRFGQSNFGYDDQGKLISAGYTASPELQAIQNRTMADIAAYNPAQYQEASQGMFNLGKKYFATSPEQAASDWYAQQRNLLAPGYENALANIRNQTFQTGRSGLGVGGTAAGNRAQANPELAAFYNAQAAQNERLAAQADIYGRERTNYGISLMSGAPQMFNVGYSPIAASLGLTSQVEGLAQQPLALSSELAGRQSTAGANAGQFLYSGGLNAARTQQMANQYSLPGATLTAFGTSPQASAWFDKLINKNTTGLSYNPGAGYGTATGYQSWDTSNPELVQTQQTYGV